MSKLPVCNIKGERVGEISLPDELVLVKKGSQAVHDVVVAHQAGLRAGTASTLTKGEVAGSNKKPWKQKGTGRARAGYRQSPVWRGGGVVFGPKPRSFAKKVPKKVARLAFRRAFGDRVAAGDVIVVDEISLATPRTKDFAEVLKKLSVSAGALIVVDTVDRNLALASRNVPGVGVATSKSVHTYELLRYPKVVVAKAAMPALETRLKKTAGRAS
jgi:large subunit ribosomal protein L4